MNDFCVHIIGRFSHYGMNDLLCAYKRHVHITEWMMFTLRNEWCVHIRDMNDHIKRHGMNDLLCAYKRHVHITEWMIILCAYKETCSHYGMNDLLCAYKRHVHITEWMIFCVHIRDMFTLRNEWYFVCI